MQTTIFSASVGLCAWSPRLHAQDDASSGSARASESEEGQGAAPDHDARFRDDGDGAQPRATATDPREDRERTSRSPRAERTPRGRGERRHDAERYGARARVRADPFDDLTAAATVVWTRARPHPHERLDELLATTPGAFVRATGGRGARATLSLRGTDPGQTAVVLDQMPLSSPDEGPFDFGAWPATHFERVEVFRGGAPLLWDAGAIGGVVRLVPGADRSAATAQAWLGSFGERGARLSAGIGESAAGPASFATVGVWQTDGDHPFTFDPTPLVPGDERRAARRNASSSEADALLFARLPLAAGELRATLVGLERTGGVPGPAIQQTERAHRVLARAAVVAGWTREAGAWRFGAHAGASGLRERFADPTAEITVAPWSSDDVSTHGWIRGAAAWEPAAPWALHAVLDAALGRFEPGGRLRPAPGASTRTSGALALEPRWRADIRIGRLELRATTRLEASRATLHGATERDAGLRRDAHRAAITGRLAARLDVAQGVGVVLAAHAGRRAPSFVELFGDGAFLLGAVELRDERARGADAALSVRSRRGALVGRLEVRAFAMDLVDLVQYRLTAQWRAVPQNVGRARIVGAEAAWNGRVGSLLECQGALSWLEARDLRLDRQLPLRPIWQVATTATFQSSLAWLGRLRLYGDVAARSAVPVDPAGTSRFASRMHWGAGAAVEIGDWGTLRVDVRDLFDAGGHDLLGFPLPGRRWLLSLEARRALP
ncbi:MAG: TonB-dependent receptor [Myxococcota bacterium]|nr:TonB-dependent receptor [Myxococcota bacterium]MDW8363906.1 TonB-dependent receptor [Myxococcales bacterium]